MMRGVAAEVRRELGVCDLRFDVSSIYVHDPPAAIRREYG